MDNSETTELSCELNKKATKAGIWYTIGNFLLKGCAFLTLPIFTRILSTSDFGIYHTYIAYEAIIAAILGLGFYGTIKNARIKFQDAFNEYISSIITFSIIFFALAILLANIFYPYYSDFVGFSRLVVNFLICQSFGTAIIQMCAAKYNIEFKYKSYLLISVLSTLGNILLSIVLILWVFPNERSLGRIMGNAIPVMAIGIALIAISFAKGKTFFNKNFWKYSLVLGLPLVPHVISQSLLTQFDRIMITNMVGESESGIYSFVYTICTILAILSISLDNAWTPWVYMKKKDGLAEEIKSPANRYIFLFSLMTIGFICVMPEVAKLFGDEQYWSAFDLIIPLSISNFFIFLYFLPVNIEYYHNKIIFISIGTVLAASLNFGLNYLFIPMFGYKAAAYTTLASYFVLFLAHCLISIKFGFGKAYSVITIVLSSGVVCLIGLLLLLIWDFALLSIILRYCFVAAIIILLIVFRKDFISAFRKKKIQQ